MTIDTSREAVERLNTHRVYIDRTMRFDEGITWTTVAGIYPHAYVPEDFALALLARAEAAEAERDAALAEVARLSTSPDDAEVAALVAELGEPLVIIEGYSADYVDTDDVRERMGKAADALTRLSHALAAETAKREAMEVALRTVETDLAEAEDKFHIASFYISDEQTKTCVMDRVKWMAKAGSRVSATLAKHGSK